MKTEHLNFLDIKSYLAPGFSYAQFLKAYECEETKGFFPYEWIDGLEKLEDTSLPPHEAFYSSLKNENITQEEYRYCQQVWEDNEMTTVKDFLVWYNYLDVGPFVEAVEKMKRFWRNRKIDMLKDGISVPGLTMKYLFSQLHHDTYFSIFNEKNKDLYHLFKNNNCRGPSIVFHRYQGKGKTHIRQREMQEKGKEAKLCENIVGYDANALYLWAIMQDMPTGSYTRRREENNFKREWSSRMADDWIQWEAEKRGIRILFQLNQTEKRIGDRQLPVDGFHKESQTVFQFYGCFWHGHQCHLTHGKEVNEKRGKSMVELYDETKANTKYIEDQGYRVVELWEC